MSPVRHRMRKSKSNTNHAAEQQSPDFTGKSLPFAAGRREGGVLLHVTSLPGRFGIGDLGPAAYQWIDQLAAARQSWWQILPLGPTSKGDSPYQCLSAFAGNPLLFSPDLLVEDGLISAADLPTLPDTDRVDFPAARRLKNQLLKSAFKEFRRGGSDALRQQHTAFIERTDWVLDFARFMTLTSRWPKANWTEWPTPLRKRTKAAMADLDREFSDHIAFHGFIQFLFFRHLTALRRHAHKRGVGLIGDVPIFVGHHSADVWANPHLFQLDRNGHSKAVAGVPPDAFSADGQCWNNPLYDWQAMAADGYDWWTVRMAAAFAQTDAVRLDHFRGFEAYWKIPAGKPATAGRWVEGPGGALYTAMTARLGRLPMIAEDLGVITPAVEKLRDDFKLPGMRVLQFGFGGLTDSIHLPHRIHQNTVAYTGTHDNDTTVGWFGTLTAPERDRLGDYIGSPDAMAEPAWAMIRLAWASTAALSIAPAQDLLALPTSARMNTPGTTKGNWGWRSESVSRMQEPLARLAQFGRAYART
jgi:4-alpha-glucanotransferase